MHIDTHPAPQMTLREHTTNGKSVRWDLYVTGWRVGTYTTESGAIRAVERWKTELAAD